MTSTFYPSKQVPSASTSIPNTPTTTHTPPPIPGFHHFAGLNGLPGF